MTSFLTIGELVGLAIGTPEPGAVNFSVLQVLLRSIVKALAIGDVQTDLDQKAIDDLHQRATEASQLYRTLIPLRERTSFSKEEVIGEDDGYFPDQTPPRRRSSLLTSEDVLPMMAMNRGRRASTGSTGMIRADERARPLLFKKPLTPMLSIRELERKVSRLEENWSKMNQLRLLKQQHSQQKEEGSDDVDLAFRPPMSVSEMWQSVQFEKKLDTNTEGVNKLMSLTQDIIRKLQKLNESEAEQRQMIEQSHDKLQSLAPPQCNLDTIQMQLNYLSEMVQQLPPASTLNNFITWAGLESSLRGDDPLHILFDAVQRDSVSGPFEAMKETRYDPEAKELKSVDGKTHHQPKTKRKKLLGRKPESQPEGKEMKSPKDRQTADSHPQAKGVILRGTGSSGMIVSATISGDDVSLAESESLESAFEGSDVIRVDTFDHGRPVVGLSPEFLSRLQALGKVNERFAQMESKLEQLEGTTGSIQSSLEDRGKEVSPSKVVLNNIARQIEAVNKELSDYKETKIELNAVQEELGSSQMPAMAYSQSILAASRAPPSLSIDEMYSEAPAPEPTSPTDEGPQRTKRGRSVALDTIEKSMKVIDSTLAVLQRSVKDLDDKLKKQLESVNRRMDQMRVEAMEAATPIATPTSAADDEDDDEEEAALERSRDNLGSRVSYLEKTMAEKQRRMKTLQNQMSDLSADVSSQLEGMLNRIEAFVSRMELELSQKPGGVFASASATGQDDTMNVMYGVHSTFSDTRSEVEKIKRFTLELYDSSKRHHSELDNLRHYADDLKVRADKTEEEVQVNRNSLEQKVDSARFDDTCDELSKTMSTLLSRVVLLDSEWKKAAEKLGLDLMNLISREEFNSLTDDMTVNIRDLTKKLSRLQKQVDELRFLGDDAAAVKRQLFSCLCCDRPVVMATKSPKPSIPYREALMSRRSTKPFTTYGLDQLRQKARGFVRPRNMSNYERALFERHLTLSSIRDLRSDCANYWRGGRNEQHSSVSEGVVCHPPVHTVSEASHLDSPLPGVFHTSSKELEHGAEQVVPVASQLSHRQLKEEASVSVLSKDATPQPISSAAPFQPISSAYPPLPDNYNRSPLSNDDTVTMRPGDDAQQQQMNPSEGDSTSGWNDVEPMSSPRNRGSTPLRRGTPANLVLSPIGSVKTKAVVRPLASVIAEESDGAKRRSSGEVIRASPVKRRGTGYVTELSLPVRVPVAPRRPSGSLAEEDDLSPGRRRSSASSAGGERARLSDGSVQFSLQPHLAKRRQTPVVSIQGRFIKTLRTVRSTAPAIAEGITIAERSTGDEKDIQHHPTATAEFTIAEEDAGPRQLSAETSNAKEEEHDDHITNGEVDPSTALARQLSNEASNHKEAEKEEEFSGAASSEKKPDENS